MKKVLFILCVVIFGVDAKIWHISPSGTGNRAEGTGWASAIQIDTLAVANLTAGDTIYILGGEHTVNGNIDISTLDGTGSNTYAIIGLKSTTTNEGINIAKSDWAYGSGRPLINCSSFQLKTGDYYNIRQLSFRGTVSTAALYTGGNCFVDSCKFDCVGGYGLQILNYCTVLCSEFYANYAGNVLSTGSGCNIYYNKFISDPALSSTGISLGGSNNTISFNIFNRFNIAINVATRNQNYVLNNVFYANNTDVSAMTANRCLFINNINDSTKTTSYYWTTGGIKSNVFLYNHGDDARCAKMWGDSIPTGDIFGPHGTTTGDPKFLDAASRNFLIIDTTSPCYKSGLGL